MVVGYDMLYKETWVGPGHHQWRTFRHRSDLRGGYMTVAKFYIRVEMVPSLVVDHEEPVAKAKAACPSKPRRGKLPMPARSSHLFNRISRSKL